MILLNKSTTFNQALVCMMMAMSLNALGNSGVAVAPQDMSPKFAGTLFGKMRMPLRPRHTMRHIAATSRLVCTDPATSRCDKALVGGEEM